MILLGKRGTGKSVLMKDIMYNLRHEFDFGIAIAPNQDTIEAFRDFMPDMYIYKDFDGDMILDLINNIKITQENGIRKRFFIIMDDCMKNKAVFNSEGLKELANNGRHYELFTLITAQDIMGLPPGFRKNADYVVALSDTDVKSKRKTWEECFGVFPNFPMFEQAFDLCTMDRHCLVVDRTRGGATLLESVSRYKADPNIGKFMVGNRDYWKLSYMFAKRTPIVPLLKNDALQNRRKRKRSNENDEELEATKAAMVAVAKGNKRGKKNDEPLAVFIPAKAPKPKQFVPPVEVTALPTRFEDDESTAGPEPNKAAAKSNGRPEPSLNGNPLGLTLVGKMPREPSEAKQANPHSIQFDSVMDAMINQAVQSTIPPKKKGKKAAASNKPKVTQVAQMVLEPTVMSAMTLFPQ